MEKKYIYEVISHEGHDCVEASHLMKRLNNGWEAVVLRRDFVVLKKEATEDQIKAAVDKELELYRKAAKYLG